MWYLNPFALLFTLCNISQQFFHMLRNVAIGIKPLRIIIYLDGINPGNPLAPDPQKLLQAIYWTFAELPHWFLTRKDAWFCFSLVREIWAEELQGQISELARLILLVFFGEHGSAFQKGVVVSHGGESFVCSATFAGFLADEKGLKQVFGITGQAGNVPCINCLNVRNRWCALKPGEQHFWDPALGSRKQTNRFHVAEILKRLTNATSNKERKRLQTASGFNFVPTGLLFCVALATIIDVPSIYLRDWMHTFASNGVAGTHLSLVCQALAAAGVCTQVLRTYSHKFRLPKSRRGKVTELYFKDDLMATDHVRHFASDVLGMVSILYAFLTERIAPKGILTPNIECFSCLYAILCILRRGEVTAAIRNTLHELCLRHNTLFLQLYGTQHAKIKFHHVYHIADLVWYLGSSIGCFPTERKNKDAIAVSEASDKNLAKTSVVKFLQRTLRHWEKHVNCCTEQFLTRPRTSIIDGQRVQSSTAGTFRCGDICKDDMVFLMDGSLGKVVSLWALDETIMLRLEIHRACIESRLHFELNPSHESFVDSRLVVEPVFWYPKHDAIIAIVPAYD